MVNPGSVTTVLCWGTVPHADLEQLLRAADAVGFDAVTISPALHLAVLDDGGRQARQLLDQSAVSVSAVDPLIRPLPGIPPLHEVADDMRKFITASTDQVLKLAEVTQARSINLAHFLGQVVPLEQFTEVIGSICTQAGQIGCQVTLEFIPGTGVADLATACQIVEAVGAGNLGVMLDVWHLIRSGGTMADVIATRPGMITGVQVCDRREPLPGEAYVPMSGRLLPGHGELPLADMMASLVEVAATTEIGIEVFDNALATAPTVETASKALAALRSVLPSMN